MSSPVVTPSPQLCPCGKHSTPRDAALCWFRFGFKPIPVRDGTKITAVKWDSWNKNLSEESIKSYFTKYPLSDVGVIVGDELIVFDADTPESLSYLYSIEKSFDMIPDLVIKTSKGEHHYFRRPEGVFAKSDGHDSDKHPERIDIKTGRALVVLPPSTGKEVSHCDVDTADELSEVDQDFVGAIFRHNGRPEPRPYQPKKVPSDQKKVSSTVLKFMIELLTKIDPDISYEDWITILMAFHATTQGSDEGFEIVNKWSAKGSKYPGENKLRYIWEHFRLDVENPKTFGSIIHIAKQKGVDVKKYIDSSCDFEMEEYVVIDSKTKKENEVPDKKQLSVNPFSRYSLRGQSKEFKKFESEAVFVLDQMAVMGELTMIYAEANTGKTLIVIWLTKQSIKKKIIDGSKVFYINADDSARGLLDKIKLSEEFGFEIISPGHNDFKNSNFLTLLQSIIDEDLADGCVLILDTLKKFVDLMNKSQCSSFNDLLRAFAGKGGTVIALAHTNKKRSPEGKPIHAGTSDMFDDFDATYIGSTVSMNKDTGEHVVQFELPKQRIGGADRLTFSFCRPPGLQDYRAVLDSVKLLSDDDLKARENTEKMEKDRDDICAIKQLIKSGVNGKMELAAQAAKQSLNSKKALIQLIDRYSGDDPQLHHWNFIRKERGAMEFYLLDDDTENLEI